MAYASDQAVIAGIYPADSLESQLAYNEDWNHEFFDLSGQDITVPQGYNCAGDASFSSHFDLMQPSPLTLSPTHGSSSGLPVSANTDHSSPSQHWLSGGNGILDHASTDLLHPGSFDTFSKFNLLENEHMDPRYTGQPSTTSNAWAEHQTGSSTENRNTMRDPWLSSSAAEDHTAIAANASQMYQDASSHMMPFSGSGLNYGFGPNFEMPAHTSGTMRGTSVTQAATTTYSSPPNTSWSGQAAQSMNDIQYRYQGPLPSIEAPLSIPSSQATPGSVPPPVMPTYYAPRRTTPSNIPRHAPGHTWHSEDPPWNSVNLRSETDLANSLQQTNSEFSYSSRPISYNPTPHETPTTGPSPSPAPVSRRVSRVSKREQGTSSSSGRSRSPTRRGGRAKGKRFRSRTREEIAKMRQLGACWRCAMQRDKCDENEPCTRCQQSLQRSHLASAHVLGCDRRDLVVLVGDFLPASMAEMNTREALLEYMTQRIFNWYNVNERGIIVPLTCGCGPVIDWVEMWEFIPSDQTLYFTMMYTEQNPNPVEIKSPCLGLPTMTDHEYARCDRFVDTVVTNHLDEFAAKCFEEEHDFQKEALRLLCRLYRDCPKEEKTLRKQLKEILRMLVVTHIVSTTFGIPDACARTVLPRLQQGGHPAQFGSYPSPRVASHQLKFYFSRVRHDAYHKILKYLNSLLKAATDKSLTWLTTFCIILGFAMVLEDCQQLVHVRSNARVTRHQRDAFTASQETIMECRNIDEQFQFLVALFHNKYHKRNVTFAKLSDYIDTRPQDGPEIAFIHGLQNLMAAQADYLRMQKSTTIPVDHRQQYTSRLIARFLDNFMGLQLGSQGHISHLP